MMTIRLELFIFVREIGKSHREMESKTFRPRKQRQRLWQTRNKFLNYAAERGETGSVSKFK